MGSRCRCCGRDPKGGRVGSRLRSISPETRTTTQTTATPPRQGWGAGEPGLSMRRGQAAAGGRPAEEVEDEDALLVTSAEQGVVLSWGVQRLTSADVEEM